MKDDLKRKDNSRGIYIALAICMLAIVCIGVYSAVSNVFDPPSSPVPKSTKAQSAAPGASSAPPATSAAPRTSAAPLSTEANIPKPDKDDVSISVVETPSQKTFTLPVTGKILNGYSDDVLVYSVTMNDYRVHNGVDLAAPAGTPVLCFTDGTVGDVYEDPLMGCTVVVDHADGLRSVYQNLDADLPDGISVGKALKTGDVIGLVGESALIECSLDPHLHFELIKNSLSVDPGEYLDLD
ncbi:MAG: peptidoglycan DD-metalloendopeptidase family protein [Clostridia bacterium]|nr:peptidoglycan DD-metalloendopeptidase family protein [Clostridia bacterium]